MDPAATGLLPLALGRSTRLLSYVVSQTKNYQAQVRLGVATTTADAEGEPTHRFDFSVPPHSQLQTLLARFVGAQWQVPPMYSAIHHQRRRLYDYARQGLWVARKPRRITIHSMRLLARHRDGFSFLVCCSAGTYIRSLAEDLARLLSTSGHLAELRRLEVGPFKEQQMVDFELLSRCAGNRAQLQALLLPPDTVVQHLPAIHLHNAESIAFCHGAPIYHPRMSSDCTVRVYSQPGDFLGVAVWRQQDRCLHPRLTMPWPILTATT